MSIVPEGQERRFRGVGRWMALTVGALVFSGALLIVAALIAPLPAEGVECQIVGLMIRVDNLDCESLRLSWGCILPQGFTFRPESEAYPGHPFLRIRFGDRLYQLHWLRENG